LYAKSKIGGGGGGFVKGKRGKQRVGAWRGGGGARKKIL